MTIKDGDRTQVHVSALSVMFGLSVRRVNELAEEFEISRLEKSVFPLEPFVLSYTAQLKERIEAGSHRTDTERRHELKDRILEVEVKHKELDFEERVGAVVSAQEVEDAAANEGRKTREALMRLPTILATELATETDVHVISARLRGSFRDLLEDLAQIDLDDEDEDEDE